MKVLVGLLGIAVTVLVFALADNRVDAEVKTKEFHTAIRSARADYEAEVAKALNPVTRQYVKSLKKLQDTFAKKRDFEGALAVSDEIVRVRGLTRKSRTQPLLGSWDVLYRNGVRWTYDFQKGGTVRRSTGHVGKWRQVGGEIYVEPGDGTIERLVFRESLILELDHFSPKDSYPNGKPKTTGVLLPPNSK